MSRVLVLGAGGMLGHKLCSVLAPRAEVFATFHRATPDVPEVFKGVTAVESVDVTDTRQIADLFSRIHPDVIVNAVGIVKQLAAAKEAIPSIVVNSLLPHQLADAAVAHGAKLIHISTDCVFSGARGGYRESDTPDPVDLYGRSKLLGEVGSPALTLRTSIIGRELGTRVGLVEWFLSHAGGQVRGFARAIYTGVTTATLADVIGSIVERGVPIDGLWHVSTDRISKYDLLLMLDREFGTMTRIDRDDLFVCDRSLESDRFWQATGLARPTWPAMIRAMREDPTPYDAFHRAHR